MPTIKDDAIVLRAWDFSETSQTAVLFSRSHGLIRALAKGSKRPKARYSGGLDALTLGEAVAIIKPALELATLTEWDLREVFRAARTDLRAHRAALYFADLALHALHDHDPHPALFDALLAALRDLDRPEPDLPLTALRFQWAALVEAGYRPDISSALDPAGVLGLSADTGGLTSDPGARALPPGPARVWRVRAETVRLLRDIDDARAGANGVAVPPDPATAARACRLLGEYIAAVLGRMPPTTRAFISTLPPAG